MSRVIDRIFVRDVKVLKKELEEAQKQLATLRNDAAKKAIADFNSNGVSPAVVQEWVLEEVGLSGGSFVLRLMALSIRGSYGLPPKNCEKLTINEYADLKREVEAFLKQYWPPEEKISVGIFWKFLAH